MDIIINNEELTGKLFHRKSLDCYTSWRVGGVADVVYVPKNLADLVTFLKKLPETIPLTWLGLGSNTLVRDGGIDGVVIVTQGALRELTMLNDEFVRAEAGASAGQLARFTARQDKSNLEFMAGIPGTVGGALAMNAGCYGGETWDYVSEVQTITRAGEIKTRQPCDFKVSYRHVVRPENEWFVSATFKLKEGVKAESLQAIRAMLEKRNASQPTGLANCGSVFRNPPSDYAARLVESAGLKGFSVGGATVSTKHANFIINEKNATAADIEQLITKVAATIKEKYDIDLIREVCIMGKE